MTPPRKMGMYLDGGAVVSRMSLFEMVVYPSRSRKGVNTLDVAFLEDGRVLLFEEGSTSAFIPLDDTACPEAENPLLIRH